MNLHGSESIYMQSLSMSRGVGKDKNTTLIYNITTKHKNKTLQVILLNIYSEIYTYYSSCIDFVQKKHCQNNSIR